MPYYGDTPGQASGLQLQDEASQRQYALGLAQQQLAAQQAAADLNFRKQAFQQGLVDSSLARADQRALNDRTFAFEDKALAAKTKQNQEASEAATLADAKNMVAQGIIPDEDTLLATFSGKLGKDSLEQLARYGGLATDQKAKHGVEAAKFAQGLNNDLKSYREQVAAAKVALGKAITEDPARVPALSSAVQTAQAALLAQREKLNGALAKSHMDQVIAIGDDGIFKSTLPTDVKPFRLPKPVTRGLRPTPTAAASAPLGARATYDPSTGWSGPGTGPNSGIEAAGRWSGGLTNTPVAPAEAPYAGADDRGVGFAPPAAPVAPAGAPVSTAYVRIPGNNTHVVRADAQRLVDAKFHEINMRYTEPGQHRAAVQALTAQLVQAGIMQPIVVPPPRFPQPEMRFYETMSH